MVVVIGGVLMRFLDQDEYSTVWEGMWVEQDAERVAADERRGAETEALHDRLDSHGTAER